ncbi:MAG: HPr family phosphocarrier protein [Lachnospiraceae bacterium]
MVSGKAVVKNKKGLHIKPAGAMGNIALSYSCSVYLKVRNYNVNAKSVLGILSAQVKENEEIEIVCDGSDEEECLQAILKGIHLGFNME